MYTHVVLGGGGSCLRSAISTTVLLLLLVGQVASLVVNVHNRLVTGFVEGTELLASRSVLGLVEVGQKRVVSSVRLLGETKLVIDGLCLLCRLGLRVEVLKGLRELGTVTVLLINS